MEALIPAPADYEGQSVIKFLKAREIVPIKIHRQLCQVYGPNVSCLAARYRSATHSSTVNTSPVGVYLGGV